VKMLASMFHPRGYWPYTGSERRFCSLSHEWLELGAEVFALEPDPLARNSISAGYVPLHVEVSGNSLALQASSWFVRAISLGLAANQKVPFDLVYSTNNNIFNMGVSYLLARILSVPSVVVVHHLRWIDYRGEDRQSVQGDVDLGRFFKFLRSEGVGVGGSTARLAGGYVESKLLPKFDQFIVVSKTVSTQLSRIVPSEKIAVVENAPFNAGLVGGSFHGRGMTALSVGRIDEGKGTLDLLTAWREVLKKCPNARLEIAGDGSLRKRMILETNRSGLDQLIRFPGFLDDNSIMKLQSESKLFITLSRTEGFGMAVAEALAAGLPVVAWDIPPLREVFGLCPSVFLCQQGNLDQIVSSSVRLLTTPRDDWERLSARALDFSRRFSWRTAAEKELNVLERSRAN
jgi:glycosyltransferase involved in cell wall biosynthesis